MARRFHYFPITVEEKLFQTGKKIFYPAVFGIFQHTKKNSYNLENILNEPKKYIHSKIETYIKLSNKKMMEINRYLNMVLEDKFSSIIIWGAGQLTMKLLTLPIFKRIHVHVFFDKNHALETKKFFGKMIINPIKIKENEIENFSDPILISTLLHAEEITKDIRKMGFKNTIITFPL